MVNSFYTPSGTPATSSTGASAVMRSEFALIQAGFNLMPALTAGTAVVVNAGGTALSNTTGTLALAGNFATTGAFNTIFAQTGSTTVTLPTTSSTMARTDAAQTFTGAQTFATPIAASSVATMTATVGGGVPTPPNNTTTFLRGDGTFTAVGTGSVTLTNAHIFVGNSSNVAVDVVLSGDATMANTGAITVASIGGKVVTLGGTFTTTGAFNLTLALGATVTLTLPSVSGLTVATLTGTETLTNKTIGAATLSGTISGGGQQLNNIIIGTSTPLAGSFTTVSASTSVTVTSASASALTVGLNGATTPAFTVDSSTASQVAGFKVTGAATGGTVALVATDSGAAANLTFNALGTGTIGIGSVSTGRVTITPVTTITGSLTLSAALVYGGVTLSNAVTGTGNMVLSASPTFTGTLTIGTNISITNTSTFIAILGGGTTGTNVAGFELNGGSGAAGGGVLYIARNSVIKNYIGTSDAILGDGSSDLQIYSVASTGIRFSAAAAEGMRLNTANHLLIGTTTDSAMLTVNGTGQFNGALTVSGGNIGVTYNVAGVPEIALTNTDAGASSYAQFRLANGTATTTLVTFGSGFTTGGVNRQNGTLLQGNGVGGLTLNTAAAQPIYFGINSALVANFTTGGHLVADANNTRDLGTSSIGWRNIYSDNILNIVSDQRFKAEWVNDSVDFGAAFVMALTPRAFTKIEDTDGARHIGLYAQEVHAAAESIGLTNFAGWRGADPTDPDSREHLRMDMFIAPLIKTAQFLITTKADKSEVEQLRERVTTLEAQLKEGQLT